MKSIVLQPTLEARLEQDATLASRNLNEIVNEAVARYLREHQRAKLDDEITAYEGMFDSLRTRYFGEWVAIHDRELVDHDPDGAALYQRIRTRFGNTSVLIRQVTDQRVEEIWMRTPSSGHIGP